MSTSLQVWGSSTIAGPHGAEVRSWLALASCILLTRSVNFLKTSFFVCKMKAVPDRVVPSTHTRSAVLDLKTHISDNLRNWDMAQKQNYSYAVVTKVNLWLRVPKTVGNVCVLMVMTHGLRTAALAAWCQGTVTSFYTRNGSIAFTDVSGDVLPRCSWLGKHLYYRPLILP